MESTVPTITDALMWLQVGGGAALAAIAVSWLAENSAGFQKWDAQAKKALQISLSIIIGVGAAAILRYVPSDSFATYQWVFNAIWVSIAPAAVNQAWHALVNRARGSGAASE